MANSYSGANIWKSIAEFGTNVWDGGVNLYKDFTAKADSFLTGDDVGPPTYPKPTGKDETTSLSAYGDTKGGYSYGSDKSIRAGRPVTHTDYYSYQQGYYQEPATPAQVKLRGFNAWENTKKFVGNLYDKTPDWAKRAGEGFIKGALGIPLKQKELALQKEYGKSQESAIRSFLAGAKKRFRLGGVDMSGVRGGPGFGFSRNVGNFSSNYAGNPHSSKLINEVAYNERIRERLLAEIGKGKRTINLDTITSSINTRLTPKI